MTTDQAGSLDRTVSDSDTLNDPIEEALRILDSADRGLVTLKATGGVGIAISCPSAVRPPLSRTYVDIDFVGRSTESGQIDDLMTNLGYEPEQEFNSLHGHRRVFYADRMRSRYADIFLDSIEACHRLDLRDRLSFDHPSLPAADLLLSKLQVVETNEKDLRDAIAILADHELTADDSGINGGRLAAVCSNDWGWWRTATMVAGRLEEHAHELVDRGYGALSDVPLQVQRLVRVIEDAPKSHRWKLRARVGDRVRWYDLPEDVEHER